MPGLQGAFPVHAVGSNRCVGCGRRGRVVSKSCDSCGYDSFAQCYLCVSNDKDYNEWCPVGCLGVSGEEEL